MYGRGGYQQVRFGPPVTPNVIKQILIVNVAVLVLQQIAPVVAVPTGPLGIPRPFDSITVWCAAWPSHFWSQGTFWQPLTYMFLHADLMHIAFNMLALWMFGSPMASAWGEKRFLRFYLACGIGAGLIIVSWPGVTLLFGGGAPASFYYPTLGASGAVFGVLLAYSLTWPDRTIMLLFPPIPMKAIYFIPFILGIEFFFGARNVSHVGHLGGVLVGWILFRRMAGQSLRPSLGPLKHRWRRWRMRRRLRAVRMEDNEARRRQGSDDDWTVH